MKMGQRWGSRFYRPRHAEITSDLPPVKLGGLGQVLPQQEPALGHLLGCAVPSCEGEG